MASTPVSILNPGFDHENLLKNPLSIFDKSYSSNFTNFSICQQDSDEDRTSDEDQSEEDNSAEPIPEVFCNLKDIEVPIDNDIVFEVDENDSIKISSPGTCTGLRPGDMYVILCLTDE